MPSWLKISVTIVIDFNGSGINLLILITASITLTGILNFRDMFLPISV